MEPIFQSQPNPQKQTFMDPAFKFEPVPQTPLVQEPIPKSNPAPIPRPVAKRQPLTILAVACIFLLITYIAWSEYRNYTLRRTLSSLESDQLLALSYMHELQASTTESASAVSGLYSTLARVISEESAKNSVLEQKLGTLDKLSKTDPQLLKKYSKVYFLNENYAPLSVATIPSEYTLMKDTVYQIHSEVLPHLTALLEQAKKDGMDLLVTSAFRSFATQANIKASNKVVYGAGTANQFSAEQGFSEHQLGTTIDFTTSKSGTNFSKFETSKEFAWLTINAHKYGFILSYPKGNQYYAFEPWHWRFVGLGLASQLYADDKHFYDLDQREIDEYLVKIFDK